MNSSLFPAKSRVDTSSLHSGQFLKELGGMADTAAEMECQLQNCSNNLSVCSSSSLLQVPHRCPLLWRITQSKHVILLPLHLFIPFAACFLSQT